MPDTFDDSQLEANPLSSENFEELFNESTGVSAPAEGILQGHVLTVTDKEILVDFGSKSEGIVPIEQVRGPNGEVTVQRGDTIEVVVDREGSHAAGYTLLSHEKAVRLRSWENLERAQEQNLAVLGRVVGRVKGGLSVDVGVLAFMPGSQIDVRPVHHVEPFIGQDIPVKVVKLNRRRNNVVVSRKLAVEEDEKARRNQALEHLSDGAVVTGVVKNLTEYGAFIDLGGIDGLLHVSDISHGRIAHPSEALHVGDEITVKVLKFDRTRERISLGMKQVVPDPWEQVAETYPMGARVIGRVVSVTDYGAFVEIEPGIEGLIHISEMTWSRRMKHPNKVVHVGDEVEAVVLEVKPKERRISLGIKQLEADPWTTVAERYSVGSVVEGRVRKLSDFGAFIEIEEGVDGLVHISDLSWTKRVKHPSEILKKGQVVQAVILHIDAGNRRLSLGVKQLQPDAWETFFQNHHVGDVVRGRPCRVATFGIFVEVAPGVEALCHNSEIVGVRDREPATLPMGEEFEFKIIKMNEAEKRIGLSQKALTEDQERERLGDYQRRAVSVASSMEGLLNSHSTGDN